MIAVFICFEGDFCNEDYDGCGNKPCLAGTNCTDLSPAEEVLAGKGFNCSTCPVGYFEDLTDFNCIGEYMQWSNTYLSPKLFLILQNSK